MKEIQMNPEELLAFKIYNLWNEKVKKTFPIYAHNKIKSGDPRRSLTFKIAYKLSREKTGLLLEEDYPLYIQAQLDILKLLSQNETKPVVSPHCLIGDKAWKRWKLWKSKYDKIKFKKELPKKVTNEQVFLLLDKTKEFISSKIQLNIENYIENKDNIKIWINIGNISPYYVILSPFIKIIFKEGFDIDLNYFIINPEIENYFKKKFDYEFQTII